MSSISCFSCGIELPASSKVCLECGKVIMLMPQLAQPSITAYKYREFVFGKLEGNVASRVGPDEHIETNTRVESWQHAQHEIKVELQSWLDNGWQPIGEVGPAGIVLRRYKRSFQDKVIDRSGLSGFILMSIYIFSGLFLIGSLFTYEFVEPVEFRVRMRRPKL